jgi:hypothetical protein
MLPHQARFCSRAAGAIPSFRHQFSRNPYRAFCIKSSGKHSLHPSSFTARLIASLIKA